MTERLDKILSHAGFGTRKDAKKIPVIAMTANVFDEDKKRSKEAGMNAHLSKPIEPDRLYETLVELITENERNNDNS